MLINIEEWRQVLDLLTKKITREEQAVLDKIPDLKEVEGIITNFPANKSPGLDGC